MKVIYGPIVSSASGRFGGVVASVWKGVTLFRRFVAPSNPNSSAQQEVRNIFRTLTVNYTLMTTEVRAAWTTFAQGKRFIARNRYIAMNVPALNGEVDGDNLVATPGDASTIPPVNISAVTPGVDELVVDVTAPTVPTGWTLQAVVAACTRDLDYSGSSVASSALQWHEAEDVSDPYNITITGLSTGSLYQVRAFIRWLAPDGSVRYSASLASTGTPT